MILLRFIKKFIAFIAVPLTGPRFAVCTPGLPILLFEFARPGSPLKNLKLDRCWAA